MATRGSIFELLARAGTSPSRAEALTRHVAESGLVRRGPRGRPKRGEFAYTPRELAVFVLAMAAPESADGARMAMVFAEHRPDPEQTTPGAVDNLDITLPEWLAATLENLSEPIARREAYRQAAGAFIEFTTEGDNPGEAAAMVARVEWGPKDARRRIIWRSAYTSLRDILGEPPPRILRTTTVHVAWAILLDLTAPPPKEIIPDDDAGDPARPPAPIDQPHQTNDKLSEPDFDIPNVAEREREIKR